MHRISTLVLLLLAMSGAWAQNPRVEFKTSMGSFALELYADKAPKTVANFIQYVNSGFYNGTIFHRVIDGFMIQGGGFEPGMREKRTRAPIENEAGAAFNAGLKNELGTVAMARTPNPHSEPRNSSSMSRTTLFSTTASRPRRDSGTRCLVAWSKEWTPCCEFPRRQPRRLNSTKTFRNGRS